MDSKKVVSLVFACAVLLSGCRTGPIRSTTLGHEEYATVNWVKESSGAIKPFAFLGGAFVDTGLIVADTVFKSVDNIVVRPPIDTYVFLTADTEDDVPTAALVILSPLLIPSNYIISLLNATLGDTDVHDTLLGDGRDRRRRARAEEARLAEAKEKRILEESFQEVKDLISHNQYKEALEKCMLIDVRSLECDFTRAQTQKDFHVKNCIEGLFRQKIEELLQEKKYAEAWSVWKNFETEFLKDYQITSRDFQWLLGEMEVMIRSQHYDYVESNFLSQSAKFIQEKSYAQALSICDDLDTDQVIGEKGHLEFLVESQREEIYRLIKADFLSRIEKLIKEKLYEQASALCDACEDEYGIKDKTVLREISQSKKEELTDMAFDQEKDLFNSKVYELIEGKRFDEARNLCQEFNSQIKDVKQEDVKEYRDVLLSLIQERHCSAVKKEFLHKIEKLMKKNEYQEALALCQDFNPYQFNEKTILFVDLIKGQKDKVLNAWYSSVAEESVSSINEFLKTKQFADARRVCDTLETYEIEGRNVDLIHLADYWRTQITENENIAQRTVKLAQLRAEVLQLEEQKDNEKFLACLQRAKELKDEESLFKLGLCLYKGLGCDQSYEEAFKLFRSVAQNNNAQAQFHLGNCYLLGHGVEQNNAEGVRWLQQAAQQNLRDAQFALGNCYYWGRGVVKDDKTAIMWYQKAAKQNHETAQKMLQLIK